MSTPSQISIFPASSAVASRVTELLQQQNPQIRLRLAARSPEKLHANSENLNVARTPLSIDNVSSIKDALEGSDAAFIMNPPFHSESNPFAFSQTFIDSIIEAANASTTLKRIVYLSSIAAEQPQGTGVIRNVYIGETSLLANLRDGIELVALRPPFFVSNLRSVLPFAINPPHILPSMLIPFEKAYPSIDAVAIGTKAVKYLVVSQLSSPDADKKGHFTAVQLVVEPKTIPELAQFVTEITGTKVNPVPIPEEEWAPTLKKSGMPDEAIALYLEMTGGFVHDKIGYLDQAGIEQERQRGVAVITDQTDVDHKAALKQLIEEIKAEAH